MSQFSSVQFRAIRTQKWHAAFMWGEIVCAVRHKIVNARRD
jgi:hypothetical protein